MDNELIIEAGAKSFGNAQHPSTRMAMSAITSLSEITSFNNVLDMGCGSGILSVQAAKLWQCPVLAVDIKSDSVKACNSNAEKNDVSHLISTIRADGYKHNKISNNAPFDLIISNILAELLIEMTSSLSSHLANDGIVILSGILKWQEQQVIDAYQIASLELRSKLSSGNWVTLVMQKSPAQS